MSYIGWVSFARVALPTRRPRYARLRRFARPPATPDPLTRRGAGAAGVGVMTGLRRGGRHTAGRVPGVSDRVLILSWEYPPVIEGGLARHVRKLAEALVRQGVAVDVLTRGRRRRRAEHERPAGEERGGVTVHRVREPSWPRDLDRFVAWVEQMNDDMLAAGEALAEERSYDLVHGHDWLVAHASAALADRLGVPYVTTIHATEHGRHQGWVAGPAAVAHPRASSAGWPHRADAVIVCSYYMRGHVADIFDIDERRITVIPNGIDPSDLRPVGRPAGAARASSPSPTRSSCCSSGGSSTRRASSSRSTRCPGVIEQVGDVRFLVAGSGTHEARAEGAGRAARADRARHLPRLDRRRRAALALPDRRPVRGALDLRAVRARRARGDGLGLPVHRRRHRRPARGRARRASASGCASTAATPSTSA